MDKQTQLIKFGTVIKQRRLALKFSLRDLEKLSSVSAALITKLENGKMANFPKAITIKQLSDALMFNRDWKNCKKCKSYNFSDLNVKFAILFLKIPDTL